MITPKEAKSLQARTIEKMHMQRIQNLYDEVSREVSYPKERYQITAGENEFAYLPNEYICVNQLEAAGWEIIEIVSDEHDRRVIYFKEGLPDS